MMLKEHFVAVEKSIQYKAKIAANAGHSLHKGTPRELFIKEFLNDHLGDNVNIGTGEIIDANSYPGEQRNQVDVLLYRSDYPKLSFGGGINAFLNESVISTIEVKSTLKKEGLEQAISATKRHKQLEKNITFNFSSGYVPPSAFSYVVAYDGPENLSTIYNWLIELNEKYDVSYDENLPAETKKRVKVKNPSIDGIFVLGKGFIYFNNSLVTLLRDEHVEDNPDQKWVLVEQETGNLLPLFLFLTNTISGFSKTDFSSYKYLKHLRFDNIELGDGESEELTELTKTKLDPNKTVIDFAQNFGAWNEEFMMDPDSIQLNVKKIKEAPTGTFVAKLPLYPSTVNRDLRFLLPKLEDEGVIDIVGFYLKNRIDTPLVAHLKWDEEPMHEEEKTKKESDSPYPAIIVNKK